LRRQYGLGPSGVVVVSALRSAGGALAASAAALLALRLLEPLAWPAAWIGAAAPLAGALAAALVVYVLGARLLGSRELGFLLGLRRGPSGTGNAGDGSGRRGGEGESR
jgi:hypothetical protein